MPGFGRKFAPDERDRQFLVRRRLRAPGAQQPTRKTWKINATALDQGNTGTCVGHAWRNFLRCAPIRTEKSGPSAFDIYREAVIVDTWSQNDDEHDLPDGDAGMDFGTSIRAGAEAVTFSGRLKSYLWAFDLQPAIEWILTEGPMVFGTNWYSSMMRPDAEGIVKITPNATVEGGHGWLVRGIDTKRSLARGTNSWGDEWGKSGEFFIPLRDLERLIHEDGEACSAIEQRLQPKLVTPPPQAAAA